MAKAKELKKTGGMSKFQQMAAKGKKGMGGMSDSTSANDAGMEMMENTEAMGPKRPKKNKGYNYKNHSRKINTLLRTETSEEKVHVLKDKYALINIYANQITYN